MPILWLVVCLVLRELEESEESDKSNSETSNCSSTALPDLFDERMEPDLQIAGLSIVTLGLTTLFATHYPTVVSGFLLLVFFRLIWHAHSTRNQVAVSQVEQKAIC